MLSRTNGILNSNTDLSERQNPQFKQTTTKLLQQRKERKQLDKRKLVLSNQVKHFQKLNESLQKKYQQKEHQLDWLKQVRQRYLDSIQNKKDKQAEHQRKMQELRMQNTTMRQKSIQNIHQALDQLHRKRSKAHNQVVKNLNGLKKRYTQKKALLDEANTSMYLQMRRSRVKGKSNVNKFFRKKNSQLTRTYKQMLEDQQQTFLSGVKKIQQLHVKQSRYKEKINKKQNKMQKVLDQIQNLKKSSIQIAHNLANSSRYSTTYNGVNSKISKTQRAEMTSMRDKRNIGFKMIHVGSTDSFQEVGNNQN